MNKVILTFILIIFISGSVIAKSPPPGTGSADIPANVLIMLDTSGSMGATVPAGDNRYAVDIAFDSAGYLYVAKYYDTVEKFGSSGNFITEWGGYDNGITQNGKFDYTYGIAIDSADNIYVTDQNNGRVQKFDTDGFFINDFSVTTSKIRGVGIDSSDNVYAVNWNGTIEKFDSDGTSLSVWSNTDGRHVDVDSSDNIYVTKYNSSKIEKYDSDGNYLSSINLSFKPYGIAIDSNDDIYVSAIDNNYVYKYNTSGTQLGSWGGTGGGSTQFRSPRGMEVTSSDILYVTDYQNHRVKALDGTLFLTSSISETRIDQAARVIKQIVSNSSLTEGANFGLMTWDSNADLAVEISATGASEIYNTIDSINVGGYTHLNEAMELVKDYFTGTNSPIDLDASACERNLLIVVSDGQWNGNPPEAIAIAQDLYDDYEIQTFTAGFMTTGGSNYVSLSQAGGTYPDSPLYVDNWQQLYDVLASYIQQLIASNLTFVAPTIIPSVQGDDAIIQATFTYKSDHQWKGHLKKYDLNDDGSIGSQIWDAGDQLNAVTADSRNIWTVNTSLPTGLNNFVTGNRDALRVPIDENSGSAFTDDEIDDLIKFVRGEDIYNEFSSDTDDEGNSLQSGERWKLADIYHSRALILGKPSAHYADDSKANTDSLYRYQNGYSSFIESSNCGVSCSSRDEVIIVGSNAGMLHAFDSETGDEKWAFIPPSVMPNFKNLVSSNGNASESYYGVDGSPTATDIYYNGQWRTVVMAGLRQGGNSYFALDITDVDNPTHLFTFAHNSFNSTVSYWNENGTRTDYSSIDTIPDDLNFSTLGESWSQPVIFRLPISGGSKWVAAIGGGYNNSVNSSYGAQLFIIDLEDGGKILENIAISDTDSSNSIQSSVPPRVTAITADSTLLFTDAGAIVYVNDLEGKMWKVNLSDQGRMYDTTRIFDMESTASNDRYSFHEMSSSITSDNKLISFYGTGNLQALERIDASIQNKVYASVDSYFPNYTAMTSPITDNYYSNAAASCPDTTQYGWYLNLDANEKVTARTSVDNGAIFVSTFVPNTLSVCSSGNSRLRELSYSCGSENQKVDLGEGIATDAIVYKNKLYMGISSDGGNQATPLPAGFTKTGNLIVGTPSQDSTGSVRIESWWEEF